MSRDLNYWATVAMAAMFVCMSCGQNPATNVKSSEVGGATETTVPAAGVSSHPIGAAGSPVQAGTNATIAAAIAGMTGSAGSSAIAGMPAIAGMNANAGSGGGAGGMNRTAPTLTEIYETIFSDKCAVCHAMAPTDNANGTLGMIRSKDQFYQAVVNKPTQGMMCQGKGMYIVPGNPAMSIMVQKLSSKPPCGAEMPLGGMLDPADVKKLIDWISAGAVNN